MSRHEDLGDGLPVVVRPARARRTLLVVALAETSTLALLLLNLATASSRSLAAAVGPVHGGLYLLGLLLTWVAPVRRLVKVVAVVPVLGVWVAVLAARRRASADTDDSDGSAATAGEVR